jgi:pyruvate kinase
VCRALTPAVLGGLVTVTRAAPAPDCAAEASQPEREAPPPPSCLCEEDREMLTAFAGRAVDFVALSHAESGAQIVEARAFLHSIGMREARVLAKVETRAALRDFEAILAEADGIIVSRGNLGMAVPIEKVARLQKEIVWRCNCAGKLVLVTRIFDSMADAPRPTRAEATDVANAVLDGTDCVMLSGETAAGSFPVEAVKVMVKICREAESSLDYFALFKSVMKNSPIPMTPLESLASSAVRTAHKVRAALIVVLTRGGSTARLVSKYRPSVPILTVAVPVLTTDSLTWTCSGEAPARHALLTRGLIPLLAEGSARATDTDTTDEILTAAIEHAKESGYCRPVRQSLLAGLRSNADNTPAQGDAVVALHRIGSASVVKIVSCQ